MTKQKYYTHYQIRPIGARAHEKYEFQLKYFLSGKDLLRNADIKHTETVVCAATDREKLEKILETEIRKMGANELNAKLLLKQKMR